MIRYYVIVAVLLIYSHSTNAASKFVGNIDEVKSHLRNEKNCKFLLILLVPFSYIISELIISFNMFLFGSSRIII